MCLIDMLTTSAILVLHHLVESVCLQVRVFALLGKEQKPPPKRLSFEAMSVKYFGPQSLLGPWARHA